ncbi:MAG: hypothetical protein E7494_06375 [Ruminococcus albus]|nr:hypothetical protein [Ruminococcus albus]
MTMKVMSKKKKTIIILAVFVLVLCVVKLFMYYASIEQQMIRSYNNNSEVYTKLVDDLNDYLQNSDDLISTLDIHWNTVYKESNEIMRINHVDRVSIDEKLYSDLECILDGVNTKKEIYMQVFFEQDHVKYLYITIKDTKNTKIENGYYYTDELVYSVVPLEKCNLTIVRSKSIGDNWYYCKGEGSVG